MRYCAGGQSGEAVWVFDPVSQQIRPNDDSARDLLAAMSSSGSAAAEPRPFSVVRAAKTATATAEPEAPPAPSAPSAATPPKPAAGADGEEPAKHVSIPSWDDIVFGVRGHK